MYFGFFGTHFNSSVGFMMSTLQNVKSQYQYVYGKVPAPELLELWLFFSTAEESVFLEDQLHIKATILYS
jgi:hypothetical protein